MKELRETARVQAENFDEARFSLSLHQIVLTSKRCFLFASRVKTSTGPLFDVIFRKISWHF